MKRLLLLILIFICNISYAAEDVGINGGAVVVQNVAGGNIKVGTGTTYFTSFQGNGDVYSENGSIFMGAGYSGRASKYGAGLQLREFDADASMLYIGLDGTFTAATATIYKAGETFATDGIVIGDFITVTNASDATYIGATGEILSVTEESLVVSIGASGGDTPSDLTGFGFVAYTEPIVAFLDNGDLHLSIGESANAGFHIKSEHGNNSEAIRFESVVGIDNHCSMRINTDAGTYSGVSSICNRLDVDQFDSADDNGIAYNLIIANTGATAGVAEAFNIAVSDSSNSNLQVDALTTNPIVSPIRQKLGTPANLEAGFSYDTDTFTDRTTAFNASGTNVQIFASDNDYILLASTAVFDQINVINSIDASQTIIPTFEYITDAGAWVVFSPSDDSNGFTNNGTIRFTPGDLTTWGQRTVNEVTGEAGAVDYYWIKITRTRNVLPTPPTESTLQITALGSEFYWDLNGNTFTNTVAVADGITAPSAIAGQAILFVDTSDGDLKVIFGDGTTKTISTDT